MLLAATLSMFALSTVLLVYRMLFIAGDLSLISAHGDRSRLKDIASSLRAAEIIQIVIFYFIVISLVSLYSNKITDESPCY